MRERKENEITYGFQKRGHEIVVAACLVSSVCLGEESLLAPSYR